MTITRTLPASFAAQGFLPPQQAIRGGRKFRGLMIGIDGPTDTGKTEFALSAPGPGVGILLDRGTDLFNNPEPPPTRQANWGFKVCRVPKGTTLAESKRMEYWNAFKEPLYTAVDNEEVRTVLIDGDSDSWELQRLAEFGKLTQVPPILYTSVNSARRQLYAKLYDSGKIIIATNKIKKLYADKKDALGNPVIGDNGNPVREWNGEFERQGFPDQDYLWSIQLRSMYDIEKKWGVRITKCKASRSLEGFELWGSDCHFSALVETVYPEIPLSEWGF